MCIYIHIGGQATELDRVGVFGVPCGVSDVAAPYPTALAAAATLCATCLRAPACCSTHQSDLNHNPEPYTSNPKPLLYARRVYKL